MSAAPEVIAEPEIHIDLIDVATSDFYLRNRRVLPAVKTPVMAKWREGRTAVSTADGDVLIGYLSRDLRAPQYIGNVTQTAVGEFPLVIVELWALDD